jgi:hypothetical protein
MRNLFKGLLAAAALTSLAAAPAAKADVTVPLAGGAGWYQFYFGSPAFGPDFQDLSGNTLDFTFHLDSTTVLRVADGGFDGDQFDVTINGVDQGATSTPVFDGKDVEFGPFTNDQECFSCAFFDPNYNTSFSHGAYLLGPGDYTVTGVVIQSPFGAGAAGIELGAVPEPATWGMMLMGFFGLGAMLRRSRKAVLA